MQKQVRGAQRETQYLHRQALRLLRKLTKFRVPAAAALKKAELSIVVTSDKKIHRINKQWRFKDKPTDVLSFPQHTVDELKKIPTDEGPSFWQLGDIIISLETAKRQAKEKKITTLRELKVLLIHGLLHLLGYDHEVSPKEEARMKRLERELLTR